MSLEIAFLILLYSKFPEIKTFSVKFPEFKKFLKIYIPAVGKTPTGTSRTT